MIVDASVAFKWLIEEEGTIAALDLLGQPLAAPTLVYSEVGNALWRKQRRGELGADDLNDLPGQLSTLVNVVDETRLIGRALAMACLLDHPTYDCVYLAMAETYQRPLITADKRFLRRVASSEWKEMVREL